MTRRPRFEPDKKLLDKARAVLLERNNLCWVIGGSCSGKSTICRAVSEMKNVPVYDMDGHIYYGDYGRRITKQRHPAMSAWFSAPDPFAWIMSLSWEVFDALNRAVDAEYLDLLADDLAGGDPDRPLLIDGGFTHPSVLTQVTAPENILGLETTAADSARQWETAAARAGMKAMVSQLPQPEKMWPKFLRFDRLISQTIVRECRDHQIKLFARDEQMTVDWLAEATAVHFGL